jgi:hypothetical protein
MNEFRGYLVSYSNSNGSTVYTASGSRMPFTCSLSNRSRTSFAGTSTALSTSRGHQRHCAGTTWVYDHPFFIIMNLAVGGNWPGAPDANTVFPQTLTIDWVRVYQR